jgi:hypothetical protein
VQSQTTYATVKTALEDSNAPYNGKFYVSFLQGSYGNDTNIYADSDVDVVMRLDSTFYYENDSLQMLEKVAFDHVYPGTAAYGYDEFKAQVLQQLQKKFGNDAQPGKKAIFIKGNGNRRDADVLVCVKFRDYIQYTSASDNLALEGICFFVPGVGRIVNYPKQHSDNCTTKHQATSSYFKPVVRIMKNMRNDMVAKGILQDGIAPSYFIEGMLYNVPADKFGVDYGNTFVNCIKYIQGADRTKFTCANGIHRLIGTASVNWKAENCDKFISAAVDHWNSWK